MNEIRKSLLKNENALEVTNHQLRQCCTMASEISERPFRRRDERSTSVLEGQVSNTPSTHGLVYQPIIEKVS